MSEELHLSIVFKRFGKNLAKGTIRRSWAPFNTEILLKTRKTTGAVSKHKGIVYIILPLNLRTESSLTQNLQKGDIIIDPPKHAIGIILQEMPKPSTAIKAGEISEGLDNLEKLASGTIITIEIQSS
ncbi:MAG: hypothetical protein DRJ35_05085 [Thermoprotei archaeon]|nr:MAG: hypothetical protein DRJ35_05085 [Thermoprotei archaeon]